MPTASQITWSASSAHHVFLISLSSRPRSLFQLAWAPSFLTMLCCQVLLLCAALSWTLRRSFSSLTVSLQPRYSAVAVPFHILMCSHCLFATWPQYSFIHFGARQVTERRGWRADTVWKRGSYFSAHSDFGQGRLGLSHLFSFILFFLKENPEIWMFMWKILFVSGKWIHTL